MLLGRIPVTFMYRPHPGMVAVATADAWGSSSGVYRVSPKFDIGKQGSEKTLEFGRLLRWVYRNVPDCDAATWSPSSPSR